MRTKEQSLHNLEQHVSNLKKMVERAIEQGLPMHEVERATFAELMDTGLDLLTAFVAGQGSGDVGKRTQHRGRKLRRLDDKHQRCYRSIYGPLKIGRFVYGTREGQKIEYVPLDARLGLPAGDLSYVLEDWLERMCVKDAFRDSVESLVALLGVRGKVSVDTAEEHSRQMAHFAASFRGSQAIPPVDEEGELLVATADGTTVPMRRAAAKESKARTSDGDGGDAQHTNSGTKRQMAYVGGVYTIDPFPRTADDVVDDLLRKERQKDRPRPKHKRVWAEMTRPGDDQRTGQLLHGPTYLFAELAVDCDARDPHKKKPLICLLDGEKQFWSLQQEWFKRAVQILDIYHATSRLWKVAECFHTADSAEVKAFVERYLRLLLQGRVGTVIRSFAHLVATHGLTAEKRKHLKETITYYQNNREHMKYDQYLVAGYPIGSGVAEGGCAHVVKDRMDTTGMHWTLDGAPAMLQLRTLYINGDWHEFVEHRIQREQAALYSQAA
jgi:hypothetical protein